MADRDPNQFPLDEPTAATETDLEASGDTIAEAVDETAAPAATAVDDGKNWYQVSIAKGTGSTDSLLDPTHQLVGS